MWYEPEGPSITESTEPVAVGRLKGPQAESDHVERMLILIHTLQEIISEG